MATYVTKTGSLAWKNIEMFKKAVQVGDRVWMPLDIMAMEYDLTFADGLWFTVTKKYSNLVTVERLTPLGVVHRQSVGYTNLWMYCKVEKPDGRRLHGKSKES